LILLKSAIVPARVAHRILLNKVDPRSINESLDAQKSLMDSEIPVFNSFIRAYKVHERAPQDGVPIIQVKGRNAKAAASDYRKVVDELLREFK
jgi:chromosome partitioning protein